MRGSLTVVLWTSRPASMWRRTIGAGTEPQPMPRISAAILAAMLGMASTSWPGCTPMVIGVMLRAVSATVTTRCSAIVAADRGSGAFAKG